MKTLIVLLFTLCAVTATAFDLPKADPFFYQSNSKGILYSIPDKAQHFYGSQLLSEVSGRLPFLPARKVTGPLLAFSIGFFWEVWQEAQGAGFSGRDLLADALGVVASRTDNGNTVMYLNYSTIQRTITVNMMIRL